VERTKSRHRRHKSSRIYSPRGTTF
jgi:hypothetical protein